MKPDIPRSFQYWDAVDSAPTFFNLDAGKYGLTLHATAWGTATLYRVFPGATVTVPVLPAVVADGYAVVELPAGRYFLALAGVTALSGYIEQIAPGRMGG